MNSTASRRQPIRSLPPTETIDIGYGLSLVPRLTLLLTFFRSDPAVKPVDEWQLKLSLINFLRSSLSITVPDEDLFLRKRPDLHKRKRDEHVASGTLYIRDLGFIKHKRRGDDEDYTDAVLEKRYLDWRASFLDRLSGIELNLEGVKFRMTVEIPPSDDYEVMKRLWEDYYALQLLDGRSYSKGVAQRPDTIIVQGVPSRWFAEPRVSSKPSMLNTHTIFSVIGNIRNLYIASGDDIGENAEAATGDVVSGLQCKVWVQFENYDEFSNAMRALCGRSMQKEGSRLKVDYEVTWDKDMFFRNIPQKPIRGQERMPVRTTAPSYESKALRSNHDGARMQRFKYRARCGPESRCGERGRHLGSCSGSAGEARRCENCITSLFSRLRFVSTFDWHGATGARAKRHEAPPNKA